MNTTPTYTCRNCDELITLLEGSDFHQIGLNPRKKVGAVCEIRVWTNNNMSKQFGVIVTEEIFTALAGACQHYMDSKETLRILEPLSVAQRIRKLKLLAED